LITHGHADHSRFGHQYYLCTHQAKPVIRHRLGSSINIQSVAYYESVFINGVKFSFHPAGHIIGSAQIRVEYKGEIWVASGDYKLENDGLCKPFEPVKCHAFITESTFGLPNYKWKPQQVIAEEINSWWSKNKLEGKTCVLGAYALGKAQRVLQMLDLNIGRVYTHGAVENINKVLREQDVYLPETTKVTQTVKRKDTIGSLVICPPGSLGTSWIRKFPHVSTGIASGWMTANRNYVIDRGFALSDHADWEGLNQAVKATRAEKVFVTHGYTVEFSKWLNQQGIYSEVVNNLCEEERFYD